MELFYGTVISTQEKMMNFEVWPGPMEGIGKGGFITTVNQLQLIPRWMTPFVRLSQDLPKIGKLKAFYSGFAASNVPVCVQLMGVDPGLIAEAGAVFMGLGAESINLNFGCPSSRVISGGAGGGALKNPAVLEKFCIKVKSALPIGTSLNVKLRSGWKDPEEMENILPRIAGSGAVDKIFFHCRTVKELYIPLPYEERIKRFKRAVKLANGIPLIINGDISSVQEAENAVKDSKSAGVMIARPWLRDPWLLRRFTIDDAPDAETGREIFFETAIANNVPHGGLLELARMLWGTADPHFQNLLKK